MKDLERLGSELKKSGKSDALMKLAESADGKAVSRLVDAESRPMKKRMKGAGY